MSDRPPPADVPRTKAEQEAAQAKAALERGDRLLQDGDALAALPWLQRAGRIAAGDATVALSLGRALLALGDPAATGVFEELSRSHDVREVWLGLALTRLRAGGLAAAADAFAASLARHRLLPGDSLNGMADMLAAQSGAPGWCGLGGGDIVAVHPAPAQRRAALQISAGGRELPGGVVPAGAGLVSVTLGGRHLLGSPIDPARIRRVEGFVAARDGGVAGWAWLPGDSMRDPVLRLTPSGGGLSLLINASDSSMLVLRPLTQPRAFSVPAAMLAAWPGEWRVTGSDGRDLTGSPLDPGLEMRAALAAATQIAKALPALGRQPRRPAPWLPMPAALPATPAVAPRQPHRQVAVVVPVYRGLDVTMACLSAVFATVPKGVEIIVVDDASPDAELVAALDGLATAGRIALLRHRQNQGFPAAANTGLRAAAALPASPDVVLLNSDTLPAPGWLARLRAVVHACGDIGTACPLSNDASILSYPDPAKPGPPPPDAERKAFAKRAASVHGHAAVEVPTAVGFCMYIRRECLLQTGLLRDDVFAQGYGEENDFCLRASRLGWRHVAVPGAYVAHVGGASFGTAAAQLRTRNIEVLERLHPGYQALIADWVARDALAPARRALDIARWAARPRTPGGCVLLVTHDSGGGVERAIRDRCAALTASGHDPVVLRPVIEFGGTGTRRYIPGLCRVSDGVSDNFSNLRYRLPDELPALAEVLAQREPRWLELHHLLGHHAAVAELPDLLGIPYEVHVHDYSSICLQTNLIGVQRRYCGEPDVAGCVACVDGIGRALEEDIAPQALRQRSSAVVAGARTVVVPSEDVARRLRRYFPAMRATVAPHESDTDLPPRQPAGGSPRMIGVVGGIGLAKGYDTLLACAEDAAQRNLPLSFTVIGHTAGDERLLATGRVFITGPYTERDAVTLIRQQRLNFAWLPSICPETWCYTLGEALRAGLGVAVFDIGAQAERIRRTGRGWVLPLGLPVPAINNALLALQ